MILTILSITAGKKDGCRDSDVPSVINGNNNNIVCPTGSEEYVPICTDVASPTYETYDYSGGCYEYESNPPNEAGAYEEEWDVFDP